MAVDKKLKRYNVIPSDSDIFAISLVDAPAVESDFVALAKQKKPMNFRIHDEERRMIYGVALRADFDIYRNDGYEEYYINFSKDAVRRLMTKFMKNYSQKNWTKDHMDFAEGLTVVESWIVEDEKNDKAVALGLDNYSAGSWIVGCKVDDDETWKSVKEGRWSGFSIEGLCAYDEIAEEIKANKHIQRMAKKTTRLDEIFDELKGIIVDAINDGAGEDSATVEEVAEEAAQEVVDVVEDETEEVNAAEETPGEEPEQVAEEAIETVEENAETSEEAVEDLQTVVDGLQAEIDALKAENEELRKKNQKMSKQPSTKVSAGKQKTENFSTMQRLKALGLIKD